MLCYTFSPIRFQRHAVRLMLSNLQIANCEIDVELRELVVSDLSNLMMLQ
jgi:hypothetical protein